MYANLRYSGNLYVLLNIVRMSECQTIYGLNSHLKKSLPTGDQVSQPVRMRFAVQWCVGIEFEVAY